MELESILTELRPCKLSYVWQFFFVFLFFCFFFCIAGYGVFVIYFSNNFQWIIMKLCILVVDILKMYIWVFNEDGINFDGITAF